MWAQLYLSILLISAIMFAVSCEKRSLALVIDTSMSMADEIHYVKEGIRAVTKALKDTGNSRIDNMVLVTFDDPVASLDTVTEDTATFESAINNINVQYSIGNYDCLEMTLTGILLALENTLPLSYIYVFTDASPKDALLKNSVISMCQRKNTQIIFVVTGSCHISGGLDAYYEIAAACSGEVHNIKTNQISEVMSSMEEKITKDNSNNSKGAQPKN